MITVARSILIIDNPDAQDPIIDRGFYFIANPSRCSSAPPMVTSAWAGAFKPNPHDAGTATTAAISPIPRMVNQALKDPN